MIIAIISHRATCAQLAGISTEISTWWVILHRFVSVGYFIETPSNWNIRDNQPCKFPHFLLYMVDKYIKDI